MNWRRVWMVVVLVALPAWVVPREVSAAPMTGVQFVTPVRFFEMPLGARKTRIPLPSPPAGATQALLQLTVVQPTPRRAGLLMTHDCNAPADPMTDGVLSLRGGPQVVRNQVFVPISAPPSLLPGLTPPGAREFCVTTTIGASQLTVELYGWVVPGSGAAYVDLPYAHVTTVDGPVTGVPIDFSAYGVPSDAAGVAVWLDALSTTTGFASVHKCGEPAPFAAQASWIPDVATNAVVAGVETSSTGLCIDISDGGSVDIYIDGYYKMGATPSSTSPPQLHWAELSPPGFFGTAPTRLFDTRTAGTPISAGQVYRLDISPHVPADASAVAMNVTATDTAAAGFVTVFPCDGTQPETSSLNFEPGRTVPNLVTIDAGFTSTLCFFASESTHLMADLAGYYVLGDGDGFAPSKPRRMFDTRSTGKIVGNSVFEFDVSPFVSADASSVVFNLTATDVDGPGHVTAYPCGSGPPNASNLNVSIGQTVPNLVTVALPSDKHVCFYASSAINLLADLAGWYAPSAKSGFFAIEPTRWADTRDGSDLPLLAGQSVHIPFDLAFPFATAVVFNATVTEPLSAGYLTAYPCAPVIFPLDTSSVNFVAGQSVANMAIVALNWAREVCLFNSAPLQWIVDVSGYFTETLTLIRYFPDGTDNQ